MPPYGLYGVKYIGLVSLAPLSVDHVIAGYLDLNLAPYVCMVLWQFSVPQASGTLYCFCAIVFST